MTEPGAIDKPGDEVSLHIDAPADRLYEIVSDITKMGRLSPECTGGSWLKGATGPAVGARFRGWNKRGFVRWFTTSTVVAADPGKEFAFEVKDNGMRWGYRFAPDGTGTLVTETRAQVKPRPWLARTFTKIALGGSEPHDDEMREGMVQTLERLKAVAESA